MNQHETTPNSMMSVVKRGGSISGGVQCGKKNRVSLDPKTYPDDLNHHFLVAASGG